MPLTITGSVKRGQEGVAATVRLQIQDNTGKLVWGPAVTNTGDDGSFDERIQDATGLVRNYKGGKLLGEIVVEDRLGEIVEDRRFPRLETPIADTDVQLHFRRPDRLKELVQRMIGASRLSRDTLGGISVSKDALQQAMIVAVLACISFGAFLGSGGGLAGAVFAGVLVLILWAASVALTYWIGTTLLAAEGTSATFAEYLRPVGFAATPLLTVAIILTLLFVLGGGSDLLAVVFLGGLFWELLALAAAVRLALGYGKQWWRAFVVVLLPPAVALLIFWLWARLSA